MNADGQQQTGTGRQEPQALSTTQRRRDSVFLRLAAFLTMALLPIGAIAVIQTTRSVAAVEGKFRDVVLARVAAHARPERDAIRAGFGLARGLAATINILDPDDADCLQLMRHARATNPAVVFIGHIDAAMQSSCNTSGERLDFSSDRQLVALYSDPQPDVSFAAPGGENGSAKGAANEMARGAATGEAVLMIRQPMYREDGAFSGFVSLSYAQQRLSSLRPDVPTGDDQFFFLSFADDGALLSAGLPRDRIAGMLPADRPLAGLARSEGYTFQARGEDGVARVYAVAPIVAGRAHALAGWAKSALGAELPRRSVIAIPILMWIISVAVALLTVRRLVVAPISVLGRRMRAFADSRRFTQAPGLRRAPTELRDIGETFETMAETILHDEAEQEHRLRERGVLLKEVHHRVKNNLQLMSSILNMQLRRTRSDEARRTVHDIQNRLMSLASVHKALYDEPTLAGVRADELIAGLVRQLMAIAGQKAPIEVDTSVSRLDLVPDQAAPLAMLASEAFTNAVKYAGPDTDGARYIEVSLAEIDPGIAQFRLANALPAADEDETTAGLGKQLIDAFVSQLNGTLDIAVTPGRYQITVTFPVTPSEQI